MDAAGGIRPNHNVGGSSMPTTRGSTTSKIVKAALAILIGLGNFLLVPFEMAAVVSVVTTGLVYWVGSFFDGAGSGGGRERVREPNDGLKDMRIPMFNVDRTPRATNYPSRPPIVRRRDTPSWHIKSQTLQTTASSRIDKHSFPPQHVPSPNPAVRESIGRMPSPSTSSQIPILTRGPQEREVVGQR